MQDEFIKVDEKLEREGRPMFHDVSEGRSLDEDCFKTLRIIVDFEQEDLAPKPTSGSILDERPEARKVAAVVELLRAQ